MANLKNSKNLKIAISILVVVVMLVTAIATVLTFKDKDEGYRTITVIEIQGTVGVVHDNMEYQAYTGMHLEEGYSVVTSGNSYIRMLLDDDKYVKLEAGSKAIFEEVSKGKTDIKIERGSLVSEVAKPLAVDEDFIINTPNAVLAVRGTLFRVDLHHLKNGELNTDVITYGGAVSSKRIQPNGDIEDVEVTIKEGFKATVNMDKEDTVYLVDEVEIDLSALVDNSSDDNIDTTLTETNANGEVINSPLTAESVLMPIVVEDIPDDDLIDIYFASENGHSMFIETDEIKTQIEDREIDVTQKTSVYEVAEKVKKPTEIVVPDDNIPLVTTTEAVTEPAVPVQGTPNDGVGALTTETTTKLTAIPVTTAPTTTVPSTTVQSTTVPSTTVPSTTVQSTTVPSTIAPTTTVPSTTIPNTEITTVPTTESTTEITTTETTVHNHTETVEETQPTCKVDGKRIVKCSDCGEILSETVLSATGHTEKITTVEATCTDDGKKTVTCEICAELISETVIAATGHKAIFSGTKDAHTECEVCYEILSADHTYQSSTTNASCTLDGGTTYICECGYNYTDVIPANGHKEETTTVDATCTVGGKTTVACKVCSEILSETVIPANGHTEVYAGGADIHTKCKVCGETLTDGTSHSYEDTVTVEKTCTTVGELTHTCACGWEYSEEIPAGHVKSDDGTTCKGCGDLWVDLNSTNFPDSMFLSYLSTTYDSDGDNSLIGDEVVGVLTINVSGDSSTDGGYTDLTGINKFPKLTNVNCAYNSNITSLDLSGLTSLSSLNITGLTNLQTLNISGCTSLTQDNITGLSDCTALTSLDASGCTAVTTLNLDVNNRLETVNLSGCSALTSYAMSDQSKQYFLESIDLTGCSSLKSITVSSTSLTSIDFTDTTAIETINIGGCQGITGTLDVSNKTKLKSLKMGGLNKVTTLDVAGCSSLTEINASASAKLSTISGLSDCSAIKTLTLNGTALSSLDLSDKTNLTSLAVNSISALETLILKNTSISALNLTGTRVKTLNICGVGIINASNITWVDSITTIDMSNTNIENIDLSALTSLIELNVSNSAIDDTEATKVLVSTLKVANLSNNTALTTLDLTACTELTDFDVSGCTSLSTLDVSQCKSLVNLNVTGTALTALDARSITTLTTLNLSSCASLSSLNIASCSQLSTISGLSDCTELKKFVLSNSGIKALYLDKNKKLEQLTALNCKSLTHLDLTRESGNTTFSTLTVTNCTALEFLNLCNCSGIDSLVATTLTSLQELNLSYSGVKTFNAVSDVMDFSSNTKLKKVYLNEITEFTSFDVSSNTLLEEFSLSGNSKVTSLDFSGIITLKVLVLSDVQNLTTLDINNCSSLEELSLLNTGLDTLTVNGKPNLNNLQIYSNANLNSLTVDGCNMASSVNIKLSANASNSNPLLSTLSINDCNIDNLDVSLLSGITSLSVTDCAKLVSLNVSNCSTLSAVDLAGTNNITTLDVTRAGSTNSTFKVSFTMATTTANTVPLATGWDSSYMKTEELMT